MLASTQQTALQVTGEGNRERRVPLDTDVASVIQFYLLAERPAAPSGLPRAGYLGLPSRHPAWQPAPEVGYHVPSRTLLRTARQAGVRDMACVTDGRMSGTQPGAVAFHVTPEVAIGGPIGLVRDGDEIVLDDRRGVFDLIVDERELARRASEQHPARPAPFRGYEALHVEHVLQAYAGCDLDFLIDTATRPHITA